MEGRTVELRDPRALRALAHPLRLQLVGLVRRRGRLTATQAAAETGESAASCSFHLRQLAKYGLVEDAGGGHGRERPWRATGDFTAWPGFSREPELQAASVALERVIAERWFERLVQWLDRRTDEPAEWQAAAPFGDIMLYLTPAELADLKQRLTALAEPYHDRYADEEARPEGARPVVLLQVAYPVPDG